MAAIGGQYGFAGRLHKFAKAGVMLLELQPATLGQQELDLEPDQAEDRSRLMQALDDLNRRYGRGTVLMASAGTKEAPKDWQMKQERRTPRYTTRLEEVLVARA